MSRTKRSDFSNNYYCKCSRANDGDKRLSKRKQEYLKKIRSGVQERIRQKPPKVAKEGTLLKKRVGAPVKHYVNLPGWVVRNLIDICKTKGQRKDKIKPKSSPQETRSMEESVRKEKQIQKNAENEQINGRFPPKGYMYINPGDTSRFGF
nr:uncharacterized protein LOC106678908 isoform X2 [Halyomorpha halys]